MPNIFQNNLTCSYNMPCLIFLLGKSFSSTFVLVALLGDGQHPVGVATVNMFQEDSKNQIVKLVEF